jgi:signal transduction histidine kinase
VDHGIPSRDGRRSCTGQGLAIARAAIVEKHGGDLSFESEFLREGTTFIIRLPIHGVKAPAAGTNARGA